MKTDGAIYHYSGKVVTRSVKGEGGARVSRKSSVAAAAYQAGERLVLEMERNPFGVDMAEKTAGLVVVHDYSPRAGDVAFKEICAPEGAPSWVFDRQNLWNRVEAAEKRVDAQVCRQLDIASPAASRTISALRSCVSSWGRRSLHRVWLQMWRFIMTQTITTRIAIFC